VYCFDTDVLSVLMKRSPAPEIIRRLGSVRQEDQCTTSITVAELLFGAAKRGGSLLLERVRSTLAVAGPAYPFDAEAAEIYGPLRARLEAEGRRLDEPDLRIASIVLARDLTLVTGNVKHFSRVPELRVENWLAGA
jgi:tRNA(fMet)-specific endonuclease VapC